MWFKRKRSDVRISDIQKCFKDKLPMLATVEKDLKRSQSNYNDLKLAAATPGKELVQKFLNALIKQLIPTLNIHKNYAFDNILEFYVDNGHAKISIHNTISIFNADTTMNYTLRDEQHIKNTIKGLIPETATTSDIVTLINAETERFNTKFKTDINWTIS